jgi:hypothetical protein
VCGSSGGGLYELDVVQSGATSLIPRQAAILIEQGTPLFEKCVFKADSSAEAAAIIRVEGNGASIQMADCVIKAGLGAGIM